jgi:uncharacterized OB-fold protein
VRDQDFFWDGVKAGQLLFQKCQDCGTFRHPPGPMCPHCQSLNWAPHEARGRGTVCAWIISKHPTQPDENPRMVALIELEERIRMVSNLNGIGNADMRVGVPVEVFFTEVNGVVLPQFRPSTHA